MGKTKRGSKGPGHDYTSRRAGNESGVNSPGRGTKKNTSKKERGHAKRALRNLKNAFLVLILALLVGCSATTAAVKPEGPIKPRLTDRYEYRTHGAENFTWSKEDGEWLADLLTKSCSEEGWELVTIMVMDPVAGRIVIVLRRLAMY